MDRLFPNNPIVVAGGDVSVSGTPTDGEVAVWVDGTTIEGDNFGSLIFVASSTATAAQKAQALASGGGVCDSTADDVEIQAAIDSLTGGRDWIATVKLLGEFTLAAKLSMASFTRLDLSEARLTTGSSITLIEADSVSYVEIYGGILDGNSLATGIDLIDTTMVFIEYTNIRDCKTSGIVIRGTSGNDQYIRGVIIDNPSLTPDADTANLLINHSGYVVVSDSDFIRGYRNLEINPGTGQTTDLVSIDNTALDTALGSDAILVTNTDTGTVGRLILDTCYIQTSQGNGINFTSGSAHQVTGGLITAHQSRGINIGVAKVRIADVYVAGNSRSSDDLHAGIEVASNISEFQITNSRIRGDEYATSNRQAYGIRLLGGSSDNYVILGNSIGGNRTGNITGLVGSSYVVVHNIGYADAAVVEVADLENPPTEDETGKSITSEWAFDHDADVDAHHAKYTNAEAVTAVEAAGLTFAENKGITLDPSLSADGTYSGIVEAGTAGAVLVFGNCIYQVASDAEWELAKADVAATSDGKLGICVQAQGSGAGNPTIILLIGKARADAVFPSFSVRRPVYISAATAGLLTTTAPTGTEDFVVRIVGYGNTADELYFNPGAAYVELAAP